MTISDKCLWLDPQHTFRHKDQLRTSFYMDQNALVIFFLRYRSDLKILVEILCSSQLYFINLFMNLSKILFCDLLYSGNYKISVSCWFSRLKIDTVKTYYFINQLLYCNKWHFENIPDSILILILVSNWKTKKTWWKYPLSKVKREKT